MHGKNQQIRGFCKEKVEINPINSYQTLNVKSQFSKLNSQI